jgi:hypothetical protein
VQPWGQQLEQQLELAWAPQLVLQSGPLLEPGWGQPSAQLWAQPLGFRWAQEWVKQSVHPLVQRWVHRWELQ